MKAYQDFKEALEGWREDRGAMDYRGGVWFVGTWEEIRGMIYYSIPKDSTRAALLEGGMSEEEIAAELEDWQ